jgi:hypothetical protein
MYVETVDDICQQLADWMGIYKQCPHAETDDGCDDKNPLCCRTGFVIGMSDRIRRAVGNENESESYAEQVLVQYSGSSNGIFEKLSSMVATHHIDNVVRIQDFVNDTPERAYIIIARKKKTDGYITG